MEAMRVANAMPDDLEDLLTGFKQQDDFRNDVNEDLWREAVTFWEMDTAGSRDPYSCSKYSKCTSFRIHTPVGSSQNVHFSKYLGVSIDRVLEALRKDVASPTAPILCDIIASGIQIEDEQ